MVDILAIGAHPDDCEITMGGTLCALKEQGYRVGICDLCAGEAGTYGSAEIRRAELQKASEILGLDVRITLDLPDGNIRNTEENRLKVIDVIRAQQPEILFSFANQLIRHPDHFYAGWLAQECLFLAGLQKIRTTHPPHRPSALITFKGLFVEEMPDFAVDVSAHWQRKLEAIRAYESQVTICHEDERTSKTFIRSQAFWELLEARGRLAGMHIGVPYGEPFYVDAPANIQDVPAAFTRR
jgi:N-acetylglucosamine malate deacetylase 1